MMRATLIVLVLLGAACNTRELVLDATPATDLATPDLFTPPHVVKNDCGGTAALTHEQGTTCGPCGFWICDGELANQVVCSDPGPLNTCGTCGPAPIEICNGVDDDCDGVVDPGCPRVIDANSGEQVTDAAVRIVGDRIAIDYSGASNKTRVVTIPDGHELIAVDPSMSSALSSAYLVSNGPVRAFDLNANAWINGPTDYTMKSPVIDGNDVLFIAGADIRAWTIGTDTTTLVTTVSTNLSEIAVAGQWLAYINYSAYAFDREAGTTTTLSFGLPSSHVTMAIASRGKRRTVAPGRMYTSTISTRRRATSSTITPRCRASRAICFVTSSRRRAASCCAISRREKSRRSRPRGRIAMWTRKQRASRGCGATTTLFISISSRGRINATARLAAA